jgi:hypothetical protein
MGTEFEWCPGVHLWQLGKYGLTLVNQQLKILIFNFWPNFLHLHYY